jgi:hypothetical protein
MNKKDLKKEIKLILLENPELLEELDWKDIKNALKQTMNLPGRLGRRAADKIYDLTQDPSGRTAGGGVLQRGGGKTKVPAHIKQPFEKTEWSWGDIGTGEQMGFHTKGGFTTKDRYEDETEDTLQTGKAAAAIALLGLGGGVGATGAALRAGAPYLAHGAKWWWRAGPNMLLRWLARYGWAWKYPKAAKVVAYLMFHGFIEGQILDQLESWDCTWTVPGTNIRPYDMALKYLDGFHYIEKIIARIVPGGSVGIVFGEDEKYGGHLKMNKEETMSIWNKIVQDFSKLTRNKEDHQRLMNIQGNIEQKIAEIKAMCAEDMPKDWGVELDKEGKPIPGESQKLYYDPKTCKFDKKGKIIPGSCKLEKVWRPEQEELISADCCPGLINKLKQLQEYVDRETEFIAHRAHVNRIKRADRQDRQEEIADIDFDDDQVEDAPEVPSHADDEGGTLGGDTGAMEKEDLKNLGTRGAL